MKKLFNYGEYLVFPFKLSLKMKLTVLLTIAALFQIQANTYSQNKKISLDFSNTSVEIIIHEIEALSEFKFLLNRKDVDLNRKVTIKVEKQKIENILFKLFSNTDVAYEILNKQVILRKSKVKVLPSPILGVNEPSNEPTQFQITGTIKDQDGTPLPGANILEKGTTNGTQADFDGNFSMELADNNAILVVSYVGFGTKEIPLNGQTTISVTLEESAVGMDEVVVVGYGTVKKSDLTGSVSIVKEDEIHSLPTNNVLQALSGRAAGVNVQQNTGAPGAPISVRIRGIGSIQGSNEPLYVIDGFPTSDIRILNSSEVASIEILKDASATSIYGSRGANGVVLITTKQGKAGKTIINFDSSYSVQFLRKKLDLMNATEYGEFVNETLVNGNLDPYFSQEEINSFGKGFDWQDALFRDAPMKRNSLNINGGNETTKFSIGASIFNQEGIVKRSDYNRYSLISNIQQELNKKVNVSLSTKLSKVKTDIKDPVGGNRGGGIIGGTLSAPPTLTPYDSDGSYRQLLTAYPFISNSLSNPINILNEVTSSKEANLVMVNADLEYKPIPVLTIKLLGGVESNEELNTTYVTNNSLGGNSSANINTRRYTSYLSENTISYNQTFNQKHSISSVIGLTYQDFTTVSHGGGGSGYISDIVGPYDIGAAINPNIPFSTYTKSQLLSALGRLNYAYDERYLLTASFRADGASQFSEGDKWGYFPSVAAAWRISNEDFFGEESFVSNLKLRTSWGAVGSQAIGPYTTLNLLYSGSTVLGDGLQVNYGPGTRLPQDLKWETSETKNAGLDLGVLNNKLNMTLDYYVKNTRDLLNTVGLPSSMGYLTSIRNIGGLQNKGLEIGLDAKLFATDNFIWDVNFNISANRNKITKLAEDRDIFGGSVNVNLVQDDLNILREGQPVGRFWGYLEDGYDENGAIVFQDLDNDGVITNNDKTYIGDPNPDFIYGFQSGLTYKNFEFSFFIQGTSGNDIFNINAINNTLDYGIGLNMPREVYLDHWSPTNTDAKYPLPVLSSNVKASNRFIEDGSYMRLKNIELAYQLEIQQLGLSNLRLYVSGQNLLTFTDYSWWDPEVNSRGGSTSVNQGMDYYTYPTAKSITLGIQASF